MAKWAVLAIVLLSVEPQQWHITWTPHPDNKFIRIVYNCEGGQPFWAFNTFAILPTQSSARVRRLEIPEGSSSCWAAAEILRNEGEDPEGEYSAEYTIDRMN